MDNNYMDKFQTIANKNKEKYGVNYDFCAMLSMLKVIDKKLYIIVPFIKSDSQVWNIENNLIPEYWAVIDPVSLNIVEFNNTKEKSFIKSTIKKNNCSDSFNKEVSKYIVLTQLKYKEYIKNDIKNNELLSYQTKLSSLIEDFNIDGENISLNDYFYANYEEEIEQELNNLVELIAKVKYNSLTTYYDVLFTNIVKEYVDKNNINEEKMKLACEMMNAYYPGVDAIDNIFE